MNGKKAKKLRQFAKAVADIQEWPVAELVKGCRPPIYTWVDPENLEDRSDSPTSTHTRLIKLAKGKPTQYVRRSYKGWYRLCKRMGRFVMPMPSPK